MKKRNNTIKGVLLPFAAALMLSSCAETPGPEEEVADTRTISFETPALTRSAIDDAGDMGKEGNAFSVWGWYANTGDTESSGTVFNNKRVAWSAAKGWGYEGARYWHPGLDYRFYALYPSVDGLGEGTAAACTSDGTITVNGFDATRSIDLMTAQRTVATPEAPLTEDPGPVAFKFAHRLARLSFAVRAVGCEATVTAFKVNGVTWKANLSCPAAGNPSWSNPQKTADGDSRLTKADEDITVADGTTTPILGDVLLPPHTADELAADAVISMAYRLKGDTGDDRTAVVRLATGTITAWDAGQQYSYTLTVSASSITLTWKVKDWDEQNTNVSWGPGETGGTN